MIQGATIPKLFVALLYGVLGSICIGPSIVDAGTDPEEQLVGPVRSITRRFINESAVTRYVSVENYDPSGRLIETSFTDSHGFKSRTVFFRDASGLLKQKSVYKDDGSLMYPVVYSYGYDQRGNQTSVVASDEDGAFESVEFSIFNEQNTLETEIKYHYFIDRSIVDSQGRITNMVRYHPNNGSFILMWENFRHYNSGGQLTESVYEARDDSYDWTDHYRYDGAGKLIEVSTEFHRFPFASKAVKTFEYDAIGNWTRKTVQEWKRGADATIPVPIKEVWERTISYY